MTARPSLAAEPASLHPGKVGAVEQGRALRPDGRIDHGDVRIGDSLVMLREASEAYPARPCVHFVYVPDVDATYQAALAAGATSILEPTEQSWGDRTCGFVDRSTTAGGSQPTCESSPRSLGRPCAGPPS